MKTAIEIAKAVAPNLADKWEAKDRGEEVTHYASLRRVRDGAEISVFVDRYPAKGRVEFVGAFPRFANGRTYSASKYPKIGLGAERPGLAMAKEIERRLLPDFDPLYAEAVTYIATTEKAADEAMAVGRRLATLIGVDPPREPSGRDGGKVTISCYGHEAVERIEISPAWSDRPLAVSIHLSDVDEEVARRILKVALFETSGDFGMRRCSTRRDISTRA
jgi:hypothetical protein